MSSSVSSKFCRVGIILSKRYSRLKGDIVDALQYAKCTIRHDLLFCEPEPSLIVVVETEEATDRGLEDAELGDDPGSLERSQMLKTFLGMG
jgi:hypothetical protein